MHITIGLQSSKTITVLDKDSAKNLGSGTLNVFGTPAMIALMENVALDMIRPFLPEGLDSVGIEILAQHTKASPIGAQIKCTATITAVDGRKISYSITATDENDDTIGTAIHHRFVVDIEKFMKKVNNMTTNA